ncbi:MAG TPA: tetratricopeptide repeat protein, partial [Trueperaceae bacterium]|nr:tetratricopeptide repeat protein [Trueperaceae bacterium]
MRWQITTDLNELRAATAARRWQEVIQQYTGQLLAGAELGDRPTYNAWLDLEREACQQAYSTALRHEASRLEAGGDYWQSATLYQRLADLDEFDEWAASGHVRALALSGDREQALRRYDVFRARLDVELGVGPSPEFEALVAGVREGTARPVGSPRPRREPSPQPTTRFVGRSTELADLRDLLKQSDCRLVTIVGMGGTGKTRLALELERSLAVHFADGAHFVSLAAVSTAAQAVARIAQTLAVEVTAQQDVTQTVVEHLSERELLLILDNLEHLPELPPLIAAVLAAAPSLKVVAASRAPMRLQGEWLFDLHGLAVPSAADHVTEMGFAAVELFVSAARRVAPRLAFNREDLAHVASICRQVDGLPLALELAAAWVRVVPVERIAAEIKVGSDLLSSDTLDLPARHRSITAVLDRTWAEITGAKTAALMRLSVFRGGLSLEAGEAVVEVGLPILLSLINQSLVSRDAAGRLGCHPLVAQYANNRLVLDPNALADALDRHAAFYVDLLSRHDPQRRAEHVRSGRQRPGGGLGAASEPPGGPSWRQLEPDIANIEQAWFRLLATGRHESMLEVADCLLTFYNTLGLYQRGSTLAADTVAALAGNANSSVTAVETGTATGDSVAGQLECTFLLALSNLSREAGRLQESAAHAEDALALAERWRLVVHSAKALRYRGDAEQMLGKFDAAQASYLSAIELLETRQDVAELANTLNSLASMYAMQEDFERATTGFERCVTLFEEAGDELAKAIALNNLGYIADSQGATSAASQYYEASLVAFERIQFIRGISAVKNNLVVLYGMLGRLDEAEKMGLESLALKEQSQDRLGTIITLKNLGDIELLRGQPLTAFGFLEPALATAVEIDAVPRLLQVLPSYAQALQATDRGGLADRVLAAVVAHPLTPPSMRDRALR